MGAEAGESVVQMPEAELELALSFSLEFYFSKPGLDAIKMST